MIRRRLLAALLIPLLLPLSQMAQGFPGVELLPSSLTSQALLEEGRPLESPLSDFPPLPEEPREPADSDEADPGASEYALFPARQKHWVLQSCVPWVPRTEFHPLEPHIISVAKPPEAARA